MLAADGRWNWGGKGKEIKWGTRYAAAMVGEKRFVITMVG